MVCPDSVELEQGTDPANFGSVLDSDAGGIPDYIETVLSPNAGDAEFQSCQSV